jgi:hypothetical protein
MNAPSTDEPNLQVATVASIGEVMKGWKAEFGGGVSTTPTPGEPDHELPPLRLRRRAKPARSDRAKARN